jgi:hypothetical protein
MQLVHLVIYYILRKIMPDVTPHEKNSVLLLYYHTSLQFWDLFTASVS